MQEHSLNSTPLSDDSESQKPVDSSGAAAHPPSQGPNQICCLVNGELELFGNTFGQVTVLTGEQIIQLAAGKEHIQPLLKLLRRGEEFPSRSFPDSNAIAIARVSQIRITSDAPDRAEITYSDEAGKRETLNCIAGGDSKAMETFVGQLVSLRTNAEDERIEPESQRISPLVAAWKPFLAVVIIGILGFVAFDIADPNVSVDANEINGRNAGKARLVVWLSETVGQLGVAIIAILLWLLTLVTFVVSVRHRPYRRTWRFSGLS